MLADMDVWYRLLFIFELLIVSLQSLAYCTSVCGGSANCNDLPRGRDVRCSIRSTIFGGRFEENCFPFIMRPATEPCKVYVGMRVTLECNMTELALFHNGEPTGSLGSLIIPYVRQEHEGVYDCRVVMDGMDFNMTLAERSLVVRQEALVATGPTFLSCDAEYFCDETFMCCRTRDDGFAPVRDGDSAAGVFPFNAYGEDPLDITIETIWLSDTHPVDLQIEWERDNSTSLQNFQIGQWPETIIELGSSRGTVPRALLRISANNTLNSSNTCFDFLFRDLFLGPTLIANTSLPSSQTVMEGEEAVFVCEVGSTQPNILSNIITEAEITFTSPNQTSPIQVTCPFDAERCDCPSCERIQITGIRRIEGVTLLYDIEVRIPSASISDSGSVVACGLARNGVTHFRREAYLSVLPADLQESPTPTPSPSSTVAPNPFSTSIPPNFIPTIVPSSTPSIRPSIRPSTQPSMPVEEVESGAIEVWRIAVVGVGSLWFLLLLAIAIAAIIVYPWKKKRTRR